jgi:hypothetical protein
MKDPNNKKYVLKALKKDCMIFYKVAVNFKCDKEVVLTVVKLNGVLLQFASNNLQNDKEVVLAAVNSRLGALQFASNNLKNDKEVVLAAVKNDGRALKYASTELQDKIINLENSIKSLKDNKNIPKDQIYDLAYLLAIKHVAEKKEPGYIKNVSTEIQKTMQKILINNGFKVDGSDIIISDKFHDDYTKELYNAFSIKNLISPQEEYSLVFSKEADSVLSSKLKVNSPIYDKQIIIKLAIDKASTGKILQITQNQMMIVISEYLDKNNLGNFVTTCKNLYNYFAPKIFIIKDINKFLTQTINRDLDNENDSEIDIKDLINSKSLIKLFSKFSNDVIEFDKDPVINENDVEINGEGGDGNLNHNDFIN